MEARPLRTLADAMVGRRIRNSHIQFMSDTRRISVLKQVRWWYRTYLRGHRRGEKHGWLFYHDAWTLGERAVGYGGLSLEDGRWWVTAGLVPVAWGLGLGEEMFLFLTREAQHRDFLNEAWLRVYDWNNRAIKLYEKLGYESVVEESLSPDLTMVKRG